MLDFDTMLMHVGEFGLYQKILFTFQAPFCIFVTFVLFGQLFMLLYPVNYWCEDHFRCLTLDSNISSVQRRNISFRWRSGGLFSNDPCDVNVIDERFLTSLQEFEKSDFECRRNRSAPCFYNETKARAGTPLLWNGDRRTTTKLPRVDPKLELEEKNGRRKRQYRYNPYRVTSRPRTTTQGPYENPQDYDRNQWNPTSPGYDRDNGGLSNGQNGDNDYIGNEGRQYGSGGGRTRPTTSGYDWTTERQPYYDPTSVRPNPGPSTAPPRGVKPSRQDGQASPSNARQTEFNSAFAGWPQPSCKNRPNFQIALGQNFFILAETMRRTFPNNSYRRIESCKVRWNRSEIPYETIVSEGNWWCNAELYTTIPQAVFFLGAIVGGFLIGWIADTFGRVPALVIANVLGALGGALSAVTTNVWAFSAFRFIAGMAFDNCFTMMYILVLEFCGPTYRTLVANLSIAIFYTLGTILLPLLAWLIGNWRIFALVISLPMLLALLALFFVPESARWLLSKGRAKEATKILRSFAKVNRKKVEEHVFVDFEQEATKLFAQLEAEEAEPSLATAFRTPRLRRTFILLILFWSLIALVYDGHSRNILNLANDELNVFWMFGIASMTEFPADMLLIFTLDRFGRRWLAFGSMTLSGAFSFIAAAVTPDMRTGFLITAIISRFWVNVAFNIGLQYAAELLPTVIRAQGVNMIHIMGYVASIISPFVAAIGRSNPTLSLILLGAFSVTAGFLSLFLSETLGEELPNTLEEAEQFGKNQSFWNCPICAKEREEEYPIQVAPSAIEERQVVLRNALRGSIRGETYRSSMISQASSGGSRRSQYFRGDGVTQAPEPTEMTRLRRGYTK